MSLEARRKGLTPGAWVRIHSGVGTEPLLSSTRAVCTLSAEPALQSLAAFEVTSTLKSDISSPYSAQADIEFSILLSARMAGMCLCAQLPQFFRTLSVKHFFSFSFWFLKTGLL